MANFSKIEVITEIQELTQELTVRLRNLNFTDNHTGFIVDDLSLTSGSSVRVRNQLTAIPGSAILMFSKGDTNIGPSDVAGEEWTSDYIYLKNYGSNSATNIKFLITKE